MRQRENTRQDASVCVLVAMATAKGSNNSRRDGDCTVFLQVAVFNLRECLSVCITAILGYPMSLMPSQNICINTMLVPYQFQ